MEKFFFDDVTPNLFKAYLKQLKRLKKFIPIRLNFFLLIKIEVIQLQLESKIKLILNYLSDNFSLNLIDT